ncbi:MAG: hypothetical protein B6D35_06380 [Candidatus Brocadia sp. UTAMX2]|jgi:hypothetical protein|nr:MAG: hypothetical protein B6D35_06380 [Candidatus Brocadia sp. UTAMX2]
MITMTKNNPLFFDKITGKHIYESDLKTVDGDRCPDCGKQVEEENEQVVLGINSRLLGWIENTGQLIKKCQCKAWLKMPYRLSKIA